MPFLRFFGKMRQKNSQKIYDTFIIQYFRPNFKCFPIVFCNVTLQGSLRGILSDGRDLEHIGVPRNAEGNSRRENGNVSL